MYLYRSVYERAEAEYTVEKSRFISHISPAESPDEARLFIAGIRDEYKDATHNVPAFVCGKGSEHQWASDDGEPAGTSGMPVLRLITNEGLTNVVIVITRYFGGIKLGTGGLARAYTHAARIAIEKAGICDVIQSTLFRYTFEYPAFNRLQSISSDGQFEICDTEYTDVVSVLLKCPSDKTDAVKNMVADLTGGRAVLQKEESLACRYLRKQSEL